MSSSEHSDDWLDGYIERCDFCGREIGDEPVTYQAWDQRTEHTNCHVMRLRAELIEAQDQHAGAVDAETLERYRWALDEAVRFMTDKRGNPDAIKALLVLAEWGQ